MNIKELREKDARRLAERINPDPTLEEINEARQAMRKFYFFAAAYMRSFYTEQDRNASQAEKAAADEKSERAYKRATAALKKYNLIIDIPGLYPTIDETNGANFTRGYFYTK